MRHTMPRHDLVAALKDVVTAPFRTKIPRNAKITIDQYYQQRRLAMLRFILLCLTLIDFALGLSFAFLGGSGVVISGFIIFIIIDIGTLFLAYAKHATLAGSLYCFGTMITLTVSVVTGGEGLSTWTLLTFCLFAFFILTAGLVLPRWAVWATAGVAWCITALAVSLMPLARTLHYSGIPELTFRLGTIGLFLLFFLLITAVSWMALSTAEEGMRAASSAMQREHELRVLKDLFIMDANHELRTPIMSMYGNLELLGEKGDELTAEHRQRIVKRALDSGNTVLRLLGNILEAAAIESGMPHLTIAPVSVRPLVLAVIETFDPLTINEPGLDEQHAQARPVTVAIDPTLVTLADEVRLRQVLVNLVANALKYSEPGTPITVDAVIESDAVRIAVRDRGLGVPPRDVPKLFNRFVRLERDIAGPIRGNGIGLFLCRTFVEAMGGQIWVESNGVPGEGSSFCFTLPTCDGASFTPSTPHCDE